MNMKPVTPCLPVTKRRNHRFYRRTYGVNVVVERCERCGHPNPNAWQYRGAGGIARYREAVRVYGAQGD